MQTESNPRVTSSFRAFARGAAFSSVGFGGFLLLGCLVKAGAHRNVAQVLGIAQIDTAFSFLFTGVALALLVKEPEVRRDKQIALACTCLVLLIGLLGILEYLVGIPTSLGYLFSRGPEPDVSGLTRIAPTTLIYFLFLGGVLALYQSSRFTVSAQLLTFVSIFVGLLNLMGHTYGVKALLTIGSSPQTDLFSTMLFTLLGFGLLSVRADQGLMAIVTSSQGGGTIARKLLPIAISFPFFLGWLRLLGQKAGLYGTEAGVTITSLASIVIFAAITWWTADSLNRLDTKRRKAEEDSHAAARQLGRVVEKLEQNAQKNAVLSEMKDLLQACSTVQETTPIITRFLQKLLPEEEGGLFLYSASRNDLEALVHWGSFGTNQDELVFAPDECWALRRGRPHLVENPSAELVCPHLKDPPTTGYLCLPLMAYGEVIGLVHLRTKRGESGRPESGPGYLSEVQKAASETTEHLALALANLKLREALHNQSIRDSLTGLFNRRYMEETLQREIFRAARKKVCIGILMIDIDFFKRFNDVYGHAAGDELLAQLGGYFRRSVRASDVACRYGGEEFTLFLPEASLENVIKRAEEIREGAKRLNISYHGQFLGPVSISVGVAAYPDHGSTYEDLLRVADSALYRAKQEGRDRVIVG